MYTHLINTCTCTLLIHVHAPYIQGDASSDSGVKEGGEGGVEGESESGIQVEILKSQLYRFCVQYLAASQLLRNSRGCGWR